MNNDFINKEALYAAILRQDFQSFLAKVFKTLNPGITYLPNWHIEVIAEYLKATLSGDINRLIINMPPRALKSLTINVAWPAWLLGTNPTLRIISASYGRDLATKHSHDTRMILESNWYKMLFPATRISKKHNQKDKFLTTQNGFRMATSVGSSIIGEGADYLIIDDPHNPTSSHSKTLRAKVCRWFEQSFATRLNDKKKGIIILVMQRLHVEDLSAHLHSSGQWHRLKIPLIATEDLTYNINEKQFCFKKGEVMAKNRDNLDDIIKLENSVGSHNFKAQYQQEPVSTMFSILAKDDIIYYDLPPANFEYYVQSWDTAIKVSETADYSVMTCFGIANGISYLVHMERQKLTYPQLKDMAEKYIKKYQPRIVLIEDKASGQSLIQDLRANGQDNIIAIKPKTDKISRFAACVPYFQSAMIKLPEHAKFMRAIRNELWYFPNTSHDDIVDSFSQYIEYMKLKSDPHNTPNIRSL